MPGRITKVHIEPGDGMPAKRRSNAKTAADVLAILQSGLENLRATELVDDLILLTDGELYIVCRDTVFSDAADSTEASRAAVTEMRKHVRKLWAQMQGIRRPVVVSYVTVAQATRVLQRATENGRQGFALAESGNAARVGG